MKKLLTIALIAIVATASAHASILEFECNMEVVGDLYKRKIEALAHLKTQGIAAPDLPPPSSFVLDTNRNVMFLKWRSDTGEVKWRTLSAQKQLTNDGLVSYVGSRGSPDAVEEVTLYVDIKVVKRKILNGGVLIVESHGLCH